MAQHLSNFLRKAGQLVGREHTGGKTILVELFNIAIPILYFSVVWTYGKAFFSDAAWAKRVKTNLLAVTISLHFVYLLLRTVQFNHPPVTTIFELLTVIAFSVALAYLILEIRTKVKETGYFILNLAFFFQLLSSLFIKDLVEVPEVLRSPLFGLHVSAALIGYAAVTISAVYGFLYLMLYHEIKSSRFGVIYKKLPNLETLEKLSYTAIKMAFVLLGFAILMGLIWLPKAFSSVPYSDPKLIGTVFIWVLYGVGIVAKRTGEWKGRKMMILSICGFAITIFSMMVINMFFSGFHKFY